MRTMDGLRKKFFGPRKYKENVQVMTQQESWLEESTSAQESQNNAWDEALQKLSVV